MPSARSTVAVDDGRRSTVGAVRSTQTRRPGDPAGRNLFAGLRRGGVEDAAPRKKGGGIVQKMLVLDIRRYICDLHISQHIAFHISRHNIT
jgi:hypothetical protein